MGQQRGTYQRSLGINNRFTPLGTGTNDVRTIGARVPANVELLSRGNEGLRLDFSEVAVGDEGERCSVVAGESRVGGIASYMTETRGDEASRGCGKGICCGEKSSQREEREELHVFSFFLCLLLWASISITP